ncbi:flagellar biosynthesis protein FlhF [Natranaerobius thermophilus]|uniref:Flagellar biosynthesis protein FlhF n=1 Tax=Natranaerobius thermophilus (strain ATCC BAA-1301 / DSM 18059 / JW/NM-WN-LF) TaxID=457570 RepID=B2A367_NATTJ|nr:flagellar biosynthesis protein FlhF [Natranaerobius thermophilus]ACB84997.1 GTP-binding signal recognition particle SRP54 G- domain [Natranaerobius thermophilus JW/NM-WN-LF]
MKVKKYLANSEKEALEQIKAEMGNNAIILNTRRVKKGGFFGLFGKTMLEVTVANDAEAKTKFDNIAENKDDNKFSLTLPKHNSKSPKTQNSFSNHHPANMNNSNTNQNKKEQFKHLREIIEKRQQEYNNELDETSSTDVVHSVQGKTSPKIDEQITDKAQNSYSNTHNESLEELKNELNQTKDMMQTMMKEVRQSSFRDKLPEHVNKYYDLLLEHDVIDQLAQELISQTMKEMDFRGLEDEQAFVRELKTIIGKKLSEQVTPLKDKNTTGPRIISMIGPTGVGKTTTVAKLAARHTLMENAEVGLITIDTYRIAAVEQLKTYGDILSLPVEVVMTPQELKDAMHKLKDKDLIIIDTAGRSHKNEMQMKELKGFIETCEPHINHLVLSLGTKYKDLKNIIAKYNHINFNSLILTKTDETDNLGNLLNLLWEFQTGCSYVTTGQNVPDDLEEFSLEKLLDKILGENNE